MNADSRMLTSECLHIYDWFCSHRRWWWGRGIVVLLPLIVLAAMLRYNEDIMDFLPATPEEREVLQQLRLQKAALRIYLIIEGDSLREDALYACADRLPDLQWDMNDHICGLYSRLPYLISDSVYDRLDSLFTPEAIRAALMEDKTILSTPGSSALTPVIQHDPLRLVRMSDFQASLSGKTFAYIDTPNEATETKRNAALVDSLTVIAVEVAHSYPHLHIRWIGAPVIAVGNARRIKMDSALCIAFSLVLISALLAYAFPRKRDIGLILLSVSFGWLFGMAVLRIFTPTVSAIVLGIGSVLIGIAVNYPLHLLVHQRYTSSVRQTLEEVLSPLVIGNITTVGAFLALVPLQATAMRHLGIFAASMLIGTILFCVFVLPHCMSAEPTPVRELPIPHRSASIKGFQYLVLVLTLLFACYLWWKPGERFDTNLSHINYMTAEQRADIALFDVRRGDATRWTEYWQTHDPQILIDRIQTEASALGFKPDAFEPFYAQITNNNAPDIQMLNARMVNNLGTDFDYIGICCSVIVFIFLWLSFRHFGLALIAFIPMALSWIWILALMQFFGLQFNIVNIILASFIFGQGDDYTIFIVEGLLYEHRTGKPILPQYRQSILLSALIMLIGIGILAFAVHPAMHSLGILTLLGMSIVLIMALTIPPLLFKLYTLLFNIK